MTKKDIIGRQFLGYSQKKGQPRTRTLWVCLNRYSSFEDFCKGQKVWVIDDKTVEYNMLSFRPSYMNGNFYEVCIGEDTRILMQAINLNEIRLFLYCLSRHELITLSDMPIKVRRSDIETVSIGHMIKNEFNTYDYWYNSYRSIESSEDFTVDSDDMADPTFVPWNRFITVYIGQDIQEIGIPTITTECLAQISEMIRFSTEDT